jgi:hypothetical protein
MIDLIRIKVSPVFIQYRLPKPLKTLENPCYLPPTLPNFATLQGVFIQYRLAKPFKTLENPCYFPPTWPSLATLEGGSCTKNMFSTGGCIYSSVYS